MKKGFCVISLVLCMSNVYAMDHLQRFDYDFGTRAFTAKPIDTGIYCQQHSSYTNQMQLAALLRHANQQNDEMLARLDYTYLLHYADKDSLRELSEKGNMRAMFVLISALVHSGNPYEQSEAVVWGQKIEQRIQEQIAGNAASHINRQVWKWFDITGARGALEALAQQKDQSDAQRALGRLMFAFCLHADALGFSHEEQKKCSQYGYAYLTQALQAGALLEHERSMVSDIQQVGANTVKKQRASVVQNSSDDQKGQNSVFNEGKQEDEICADQVKKVSPLEQDYQSGIQCYFGSGGEKNYCKAFEHLQKVADVDLSTVTSDYEKGLVAFASRLVGELYNRGHKKKKGKGIPRDLQRAQEYYERAKELGSAKALYNLANFYAKQDKLEQAAQYFEQFICLNVSDLRPEVIASYIRLSTMYYAGQGVFSNLDPAVDALQKSFSISGISFEYKTIMSEINGSHYEVLKKIVEDLKAIPEPEQKDLDALYVIGRLFCEAKKSDVDGLACIHYAAEKRHRPARCYLATNLSLASVSLSEKFQYLFDLLDEKTEEDEEIEDKSAQEGIERLKEYAGGGFLEPQCYMAGKYGQQKWLDAMIAVDRPSEYLLLGASVNSRPLQMLRRDCAAYQEIKRLADEGNSGASLLLARALIAAYKTDEHSNGLLLEGLAYFETGYNKLSKQLKQSWRDYYAKILVECSIYYMAQDNYNAVFEHLYRAQKLGDAYAQLYFWLTLIKKGIPDAFYTKPEFISFRDKKQIYGYAFKHIEDMIQDKPQEVSGLILDSQIVLGDYYAQIYNFEKACHYYEAAAKKGSELAKDKLIPIKRLFDLEKKGHLKKRKKTLADARKEKKFLTEHKHERQFLEAIGYMNEKKLDEAHRLLVELAREGHLEANAVLVDMFLSGYEGISSKQAFQYFKKAVDIFVCLQIYGENTQSLHLSYVLDKLVKLCAQDDNAERKELAKTLLALAEEKGITLSGT